MEHERADAETHREPQSDQSLPDGRANAGPPPQTGNAANSRRVWIIGAVSLAVIAAGAWAIHAYIHSLHYESTDDAFVEAHVIPISPRVSGYVTARHIDDNQLVQKGELLVELDPSDFAARVAAAQADLDAAKAKLAQAQAGVVAAAAQIEQKNANVEAAQAEVKRTQFDLQRLESLPGGTTAPTELVNARAAAKSANATLRSAQEAVATAQAEQKLAEAQVSVTQAQVEQTQAALRQAQLNLSYTRIEAPAAGRIARRTIERGAYATVGQPMFAIVEPNVWVIANYKETQLTRMKAGQPTIITVDAYPDRSWRGHVDSIQRGTGARFSLLPPENATGNYVKVVQRVPVKILFDEPTGDVLLTPGMSVVPEVEVR